MKRRQNPLQNMTPAESRRSMWRCSTKTRSTRFHYGVQVFYILGHWCLSVCTSTARFCPVSHYLVHLHAPPFEQPYHSLHQEWHVSLDVKLTQKNRRNPEIDFILGAIFVTYKQGKGAAQEHVVHTDMNNWLNKFFQLHRCLNANTFYERFGLFTPIMSKPWEHLTTCQKLWRFSRFF